MPGKKYASIRRPATYRALRKKGLSKSAAARIANAQAAGTINRRGGRKKKR
jgi:sugar/nucleoside kinase (ribokinase family)